MNKKQELLIAIPAIILIIVIIFVIANYQSGTSNAVPAPISSELQSATTRVTNYWKDTDPNSFNKSDSEISEIVKKVSAYREVSYDRAADLIILSFKTKDPYIIEFMH